MSWIALADQNADHNVQVQGGWLTSAIADLLCLLWSWFHKGCFKGPIRWYEKNDLSFMTLQQPKSSSYTVEAD